MILNRQNERFVAAVTTALVLCLGSLPCGATGTETSSLAQGDAPQDPRDRVRVQLDQSHYAEAERLARALLRETESNKGPDSVDTAAVLDLLVDALGRCGKLADAETRQLAERAVAIKEKVLGPDDPDLATSLDRLARIFRALGDYAAARPVFERALAIREKALGPEHPAVAESLNGLANLLHNNEEYTAARPLYERALAIREKALGPDHLDVAQTLNGYAGVLLDTNDYEGAKRLYKRALAIREKNLGPDHPSVGDSLCNLALPLHYVGDYAEARPLYERALAIREKALGPDHPRVANSLNNLANLLVDTGDYSGARPLYERALAIREKAFGPDSLDVAWTLNFLGSLQWRFGDYKAARASFERALSIEEDSPGGGSETVAGTLTSLAVLLRDTGDYAAAKALYERGLVVREEALGPNHPYVGINLNDLADLLRDIGDHPAAKAMYERALANLEKAWGPENRGVGKCLNAFACLLRDTGNTAAAKPLYERALAIREKALGPDHPEVAETLSDLATLLRDTGDYAAARPLYERALAVREKGLGRDHPRVAANLNDVAQLLFALGETRSALRAALDAEKIGCEHMRLTTRTLSEGQGLRYAAVRASGLNLAITLVAQGGKPSPRSVEQVWDALIHSRALLLDEMASRNRAVAEAGDPRVEQLAKDLTAARERFANLAIRGPQDLPPERYRELLDQARKEKDQAEGALAEKSLMFRQERAKSQAGFQNVRRSLPPGSALVAYAAYKQHGVERSQASARDAAKGKTSPPMRGAPVPSYAAFVLLQGQTEPVVVPLGKADEIEPLVSRWSEEAGRKGSPLRSDVDLENAYNAAGEALRRKVWDPVAPLVKDRKLVLVVPDGVLHLVSLASLPVAEGTYLVEAGPLLHYLSAERDLVRFEVSKAHGSGLLALGDPAFNETALFAALGAKEKKPKEGVLSKLASLLPFRGERSGCGSFQSMRFGPLLASAVEVREVVDLWNSSDQPRRQAALRLTGGEANETAFKARAPGKQVLHLATHGFFLDGGCASAQEPRVVTGPGQPALGEPSPVAGENPLLLSGLALAGANHRTDAGPTEDDGVLTAEEIAALNLSGVEWAVLSACDTGVGVVKAGEGVFGLRRAFEVAGAQSLIMSLWSVEDNSTRQWMKGLYEARLLRGMGTAEAMREASLSVLGDRRRKGLSTHPFYWAAFIAAGDWR